MGPDLLVRYAVTAAVGTALLSLLDAACAPPASRPYGRIAALNVAFTLLAGLTVAAAAAAYGMLDDGGEFGTGRAVGVGLGAAALLYLLKGGLYARSGVTFAAPRRLQLVSAAVACLPAAVAFHALSTYQYRP